MGFQQIDELHPFEDHYYTIARAKVVVARMGVNAGVGSGQESAF
jgi:hypothetical protein